MARLFAVSSERVEDDFADELRLIWQESLRLVKEQLNAQTFNTWFSNTETLGLDDNVVTICAPSGFAKEWLESRYQSLVQQALRDVIGEDVRVRFVVRDGEVTAGGAQVEHPGESHTLPALEVEAPPQRQDGSKNGLGGNGSINPKYTFDSFVIGAGNRFAHAAALAVAESPAQAYNPLFIYGGVGLGKTHLLQAIAHYVRRQSPALKVKYVSSEKFTNDFINSIRDKDKIVGFQRKYRNVDVLLVDDIQFLENKEATQEEFFHTFNTLHEASKQIVMSSDRPPKDIATLEDRLRSRFEWGLITDIQPPDLETRIAILRRKALAEHLVIPDESLMFIASKIQSNIRELEGALIRVIAWASLTSSHPDLALTEQVLKDLLPDQEPRVIGVPLIQQEVCKYFGLSKEDLISAKRSQIIVYPRQVAMYLARELTDQSLPRIGEQFGNRDHTTVLHAKDKIQKLIHEQRDVYNEIQQLTNRIKQEASLLN